MKDIRHFYYIPRLISKITDKLMDNVEKIIRTYYVIIIMTINSIILLNVTLIY